MKLEVGILCIMVATSLVFLLTINPNDEEGRVVVEDEQVWIRKNHLVLPSKWRRVTPPTPNFDANNVNVVGLHEKNFATTNMNQLLLPSMQWRPVAPPSPNPTLAQHNFADLPSPKENLFLPSLQTWRPVSPPRSNPGHNSVTPIGEINFASSELKKEQVLLPSLQKGTVTPPSPNPGTNYVTPPGPNPAGQNFVSSMGEKTFAAPELKKQQVLLPSLEREPVTPPTPSSGHNSVTMLSEMDFARSKLRSQHILLPSLQKGPVTSPGSSSGHNSVPVPPLGEKNFAYLKLIKNHNLMPYSQKLRPTTPPGTDFEQNSGCNIMGTKKKFAARKMGGAHLPPVVVSLKATS